MKTFLSILGVLALAVLVWFIGFKKGFTMNLFGAGTKNPADCDKDNLGFTNSGIRDPKCGTPPEFECDPNRSGWNKAGFPDPECERSRMINLPERICVTRNGKKSALPVITSSGIEYVIEYATPTTFCYKKSK